MLADRCANPLLRRNLSAFAAALLVASVVGGAALAWILPSRAQDNKRPFKVTIEKGKTQIVEPVLPVDPTVRINLLRSGAMRWGLRTPDGKRLTFSTSSAYTNFRIDGRVLFPNNVRQMALPQGKNKRRRNGMKYVSTMNNVKVTQIQEIVPGRRPGRAKPGQKRKMDVALFHYTVENLGNRPVRFGLRVRIDMYNWTTDGPAFLAPQTMPGRILDGVLLSGKKIPDYLISIQHRNLKNPGHQAYFTFNLNRKWEKPTRVIPTSHGAPQINNWDVRVMPGNNDTDIVFFWDEKTLKPGQKRELAFAYGTSIATTPEGEGRITMVLGGSFEPKRIFTVRAYVDDPIESQHLTLDLPAGMELLEGPRTQPVPPPTEQNRGLVLWKGRVLRPGRYAVRIRSSNGVTKGRMVTVSKAR